MKGSNIKNIGIVAAVALVFLLGVIGKLFFDAQKLEAEVTQSKGMLDKLQKDILAVQKEKETLKKEQEKLQEDAISYIGTNVALEEEKKRLKESLKEFQAKIEEKEKELQDFKQKAETTETGLSQQKNRLSNDYQKKLKDTLAENKRLEEQLTKEKALYHYNLAVALTRANFVDSAIDEYEASIKFDANNADAYYNLAVLFDRMGYSPRKTVRYYKKYLDLAPNADDREEVLISISKLEGRL